MRVDFTSGVAAIALSIQFLLLLPSMGRAEETFRVTGVAQNDVLNIRAGRSPKTALKGTIPPDARGVVRIGECAAWCLIRYGDVTGWVDRSFLEPDATEPTALASNDPIQDCNSDETPQKLAGCTKLIAGGTLSTAELAVAHSRRSDAHIQAGNIDQAIVDRARALELAATDGEHRRRLGQAHQMRGTREQEKGSPDRALADFARAIEIDPTNVQTRFHRSVTHVAMNNLDSAIDDMGVACHLEPDNKLNSARLALLFEIRGARRLLNRDILGAISDYEAALKLDPANTSLLLSRAAAYAASNENHKAIQDYTEVIRLNPKVPEPYVRRAEIYYVGGDRSRTLADIKIAIELDPKNIPALMLRGIAREATNDVENARDDYRTVLKIDPSHPLAKAGVGRLSSSQNR